jgi:hypothetical protein
MKNKALIIGGGLAIVALGAFLFMRKRSAMASEDAKMEDGLDTETGTTTTGKGDTKPTPNSPIPRTDGALVKDSGESIKKEIKSASINSVEDLKKTALGLEISVDLMTNIQKFNVNKAINALNSGERKVLNYIALVNAPSRKSVEFKEALASTLGASAPSMIDSVSNKITSSVNATTTTTLPTIQECMNKAVALNIPMFLRGQYISNCMQGLTNFDGEYFAQPQDEKAYTRTGFEIDNEGVQFNGDYIM